MKNEVMFKRLRNLFYGLGKPPQIDRQMSFLISSPRSGTTWLKQALNSHPQIYCTENRFFGLYFDVVEADKIINPRLRITLDKYVDSFLRHYNWEGLQVGKEVLRKQIMSTFMDEILNISSDLTAKPIIIDKITPYVNTSETVMSSISTYFPHAQIIHLVRDGRDVLTSGVFHWLNKNQDGFDRDEIADMRKAYFVYKDTDVRLARFFSDKDIQEWGLTWLQPIQSISKFHHKQEVLQISYEEMIHDLPSVLEKIFFFLGANSCDKVIRRCFASSTFEKMSGGRTRGMSIPTAHIRKGVVGDWVNYFTKRDGELFNNVAGKYLLSLGYEKDASWIQCLPEKLDIGV